MGKTCLMRILGNCLDLKVQLFLLVTFIKVKFDKVFDREHALAVLGIAFVSWPFSSATWPFSYCYPAFFQLSVGLITIVSRSFNNVSRSFNKSSFLLSGGVLTKVGSDWIRLDQTGSD